MTQIEILFWHDEMEKVDWKYLFVTFRQMRNQGKDFEKKISKKLDEEDKNSLESYIIISEESDKERSTIVRWKG